MKTRIGIVGTGYISKGLAIALENQKDIKVTKILTRRKLEECIEYPIQHLLTNSVDELIQNSDLVVECTGDVIYGTTVIDKVMASSLPVVTMNSELQVTTGSYFSSRGIFSEAEGDQPGCLAALHENVIQMGFKPLVYGNIKGYLNYNPTPKDMLYWSKRQGQPIDKTICFTDGTKLQIEQALIANGLGIGIAKSGLLGFSSENVTLGSQRLAEEAACLGFPISDYILSPNSPPGVFIVAEHDQRQHDALKYFKMGGGPFYTLLQNYHLCHLEIIKTIRRVLDGKGILLNNSVLPSISVCAVAKRDLKPGHIIKHGIGSFDVRGIAINIKDDFSHIPIGLLYNAVVTKNVKTGEILHFDEVEIPESLASFAWFDTLSKVV